MRVFAPLVVLAAVAGCSSKLTLREPDRYEGCGTDENWRTFDDQELTHQVKANDPAAPVFQVPTEGAQLPAPKPTFIWQPTATLVGKPGGNALCMQCPTCGPLTAQHLPPVSGDVYDLAFTVDGATVYRVVTTQQTFTPQDPVWAAWRGKAVAAQLFRMQLAVNDIKDGPFSSQPLHVTVAP